MKILILPVERYIVSHSFSNRIFRALPEINQ